jgi:hypothetical protein
MAPISWGTIQPFKAVRDNWDKVEPYHDNISKTLSLVTILTAFIGTASVMIKHGFKFPRLHPSMEVEELKPTPELSHPNEYVTEDELAEVKLFEFEMEDKWRRAREKWQREQDELGEAGKEIISDSERQDPETQAAEEIFQQNAEAGVGNAMDTLDDEGAFDGVNKN